MFNNGNRTGRRIRALSTVLATAMVAVMALAPPVAASSRGRGATNGRIAYKQFFDGGFAHSAIFTVNPDGTGVRQVTNPDANTVDDFPQWSADGSMLVFTRFAPNSDQCFLIRPGRTRPRLVAGTDTFSVDPPAGVGCEFASIGPARRMALSLATGPIIDTPIEHIGREGIYVSDLAGGHLRQLTQFGATTTSEDHEPVWSPDGRRIAFTRINTVAEPVNQQAVFVMNADGGNVHQVTDWALNAGGADWSPNGREIAFQSFRDCDCTETSQIYLVHPDGSGLTQITNDGRNIEPAFSPDGKQLAFGHNPGTGDAGLADVETLRLHGDARHPFATDITDIVHSPEWESEPAWGTAPLLRDDH
jgi:TolB protein